MVLLDGGTDPNIQALYHHHCYTPLSFLYVLRLWAGIQHLRISCRDATCFFSGRDLTSICFYCRNFCFWSGFNIPVFYCLNFCLWSGFNIYLYTPFEYSINGSKSTVFFQAFVFVTWYSISVNLRKGADAYLS